MFALLASPPSRYAMCIGVSVKKSLNNERSLLGTMASLRPDACGVTVSCSGGSPSYPPHYATGARLDELCMPSDSLQGRGGGSCQGAAESDSIRRERDEAHAQVLTMARRVAALEDQLGFKSEALAESRRALHRVQQQVAEPAERVGPAREPHPHAEVAAAPGAAGSAALPPGPAAVMRADAVAQALRQAVEWTEHQSDLQNAAQALRDVAAAEADARARYESATAAAMSAAAGDVADATVRELEALTSEATVRAEYRGFERRAGAARRSWLEEERSLSRRAEDAHAEAAAARDESGTAVQAAAAARRDAAAERQRLAQASDELARADAWRVAASDEAAASAARAQLAEAEVVALRARALARSEEGARAQAAASARVAQLDLSLEMARAAWRDERARNEAAERGIQATVDEISQRSSLLERQSWVRGDPTDGSPAVLRGIAAGTGAPTSFVRVGWGDAPTAVQAPTGDGSCSRGGRDGVLPPPLTGIPPRERLPGACAPVSNEAGWTHPLQEGGLLRRSVGAWPQDAPAAGRSCGGRAARGSGGAGGWGGGVGGEEGAASCGRCGGGGARGGGGPQELDAAGWERAAIENRLAADRCANHARALEFALGAARGEGTRLATLLAERSREAETLDTALGDAAAAAARERAGLERRAQREAEAAEAERRRADRACEALHRALVQAGERPAAWEQAAASPDMGTGGEAGMAAGLRGEAWISAAEGQLLRWVAGREERLAQLAHDVEHARAETRATALRLTAAAAAESGAAARAKSVSRNLVGALHGAVREAVDAAESSQALRADAMRAEGAMLLRTERWRAQAEAAQEHSRRLMGVIGSYSVRSQLAMPTAPAAHVAAAKGVHAGCI